MISLKNSYTNLPYSEQKLYTSYTCMHALNFREPSLKCVCQLHAI